MKGYIAFVALLSLSGCSLLFSVKVGTDGEPAPPSPVVAYREETVETLIRDYSNVLNSMCTQNLISPEICLAHHSALTNVFKSKSYEDALFLDNYARVIENPDARQRLSMISSRIVSRVR